MVGLLNDKVMRRKIFILLFVELAYFGLTHAAVVNGTCGSNLSWTLDSKDSTLVITGTGIMTNSPTWSSYASYIKYVSLPDGLSNISTNAFYNCSNLNSITIPNSVISIDDNAFVNCSSMTSIEIPNSVITIKGAAFSGCSGLTSITIPNNVSSIGGAAFQNCSSLTSINIPTNLTSILIRTFDGCKSLTSITIPNHVTSIGVEVFYDCSSLTSITIPNSVTNIGDGAFRGCSGLMYITCEAVTPPSLGTNVFYNVNKSIPLFVPAASVVTYTNTIIWEEFTNVFPIGTTVYSVNFQDWDGTELKVAYVEAGTSATPPANPTREGYLFTGWSANIDSITADLTVVAQYFKTCEDSMYYIAGGGLDTLTNSQYTVDGWCDGLFWEPAGCQLNASGDYEYSKSFTLLPGVYEFKITTGSWSSINYGTKDKSIFVFEEQLTYTLLESANNCRFVLRDTSDVDVIFNCSQEKVTVLRHDSTIHPTYIVSFLDWDGSILAIDTVAEGNSATAPFAPTRAGYTFIGWDKTFNNITADLVVNAQYTLGENKDFTIVFINGNDSSDILSNEIVLKVPAAPEIVGFNFLGWRPVANMIINDIIEIEAVYEETAPSSAPEVVINPANPAQKLIRNGNVYILTDDNTYTIDGRLVR